MFKINNRTVAEPAKDGVTITDEPVWSSNTGRAASGKMTGNIVAWKQTIEVSWPPLTFDEALAIRNAIRSAGKFFTIELLDTASQTILKPTVYASNIPRTLYSLVPRYKRYSGVTITFIEQ